MDYKGATPEWYGNGKGAKARSIEQGPVVGIKCGPDQAMLVANLERKV